jgi:hypothetical protein
MLKQIPKSDISFRPFKVYKTFTPTEQSIPADLAVNHTGSTDQLTDSELHQQGLWHQLRTMYYNGDNALNPVMSYGTFKPKYTNVETGKQRSLKDRAIVLSIPQIEFGEQIKPKSVYLQNTISGVGNEEIYDDGYGNLISNYNSYFFSNIDIETNEFWFTDANNVVIKTSILTLDMENNLLLVQNEDTFYLIKIDVEEGSISFLGIFKQTDINTSIIGNVFYSHGIITITRETQIDGVRETALTNYNLEYKSTNTIYENEYLLVVGEDEFNVSTNPTAYTELNIETGSIYITNTTKYQIDATNISLPANGGFVLYIDDGDNEVTLAIDENIIYNFYAKEIIENNLIGCSLQSFKQETVKWRNSDKYQRTTLNNPYISAFNGVSASGFDVYEYSSSVDPTGSYLAPYITTIGLYDDNMDMVAVAKLAKPVKSTPDLPVNFLVRFDS